MPGMTCKTCGKDIDIDWYEFNIETMQCMKCLDKDVDDMEVVNNVPMQVWQPSQSK